MNNLDQSIRELRAMESYNALFCGVTEATDTKMDTNEKKAGILANMKEDIPFMLAAFTKKAQIKNINGLEPSEIRMVTKYSMNVIKKRRLIADMQKQLTKAISAADTKDVKRTSDEIAKFDEICADIEANLFNMNIDDKNYTQKITGADIKRIYNEAKDMVDVFTKQTKDFDKTLSSWISELKRSKSGMDVLALYDVRSRIKKANAVIKQYFGCLNIIIKLFAHGESFAKNKTERLNRKK